MSKYRFKKLVKLKVTDHWRQVLVAECTSPSLTSLRYFNPHKASLHQPHPIWTSSAGNSYECGKSTILARMVSGRYRTEMLSRFWSSNRGGYCLAPTCHLVHGDLEHLLVVCPFMEHVRHRLHSLWCLKTADCPPLQRLIMWILGSAPAILTKFILDSTACPQLIFLVQMFGQEIQDKVCYLTRTWAFAIHRQRMKMLGRWPENVKNKSYQLRHPADSDSALHPAPIPLPSPDISNYDNYPDDDNETALHPAPIPPPSPDISNYDNYPDYDQYIAFAPRNMNSNSVIFPAMSTLPHWTTTPLPAGSTPPTAGCASPHPCSTTLPASTILGRTTESQLSQIYQQQYNVTSHQMQCQDQLLLVPHSQIIVLWG